MKFKEIKRLQKLCNYENEFCLIGCDYIAGVDEAGRGSLAGPLIAAAIILDSRKLFIEEINDSKKLSAKKRKILYKKILKNCICWSVGKVSVDEINRMSITSANLLAFKRAINNLKKKPDIILADFITAGEDELSLMGQNYFSIINGDRGSVSIAAASIIAKVVRDRIMFKLSKIYPIYYFIDNKGYGTKKHFESIKINGPSPVHRINFRGVLNK